MKRVKSKLLDNPPKYGGPEWGAYQYERAKEANRGHNYRYWNDKWWKEMQDKGWKIVKFEDNWDNLIDYTPSEIQAKNVLNMYRNDRYYARIIAGYHQVKQRIKYYTVICKEKVSKTKTKM